MFQIGETGPGGGIVFQLLDDTGATGLEVFPGTLGEATFGCLDVDVDPDNAITPSDGVGVVSGEESSDLIESAVSNGLCAAGAAQLAFDFTSSSGGNSFDDWYLPSTDELIAIRELDLFPDGIPPIYWSSTEDSAQNAFLVLGADGPSTSIKTSVANVLAVRTF